MREKSVDNYYLHINDIAVDVFRKNGTSYIKVVDRISGINRLVFTMDLTLVSSNVDITIVNAVRIILYKNISLLRDREKELI